MEAVVMAERIAPPKLRAKASNSLFAFPGRGTSSSARRYRDLVVGLLKDMGVAEGELTESLKLQIRNTALLAVQIELTQAEAMSGKPVDLLALVRQQNSLARQLWQLGLGRRRRQGLGNPLDYLTGKPGKPGRPSHRAKADGNALDYAATLKGKAP
jgi:hypothetical protein